MAKQQQAKKKRSATRSKGSTRRVSNKSTKASSRKARVARSDRKKSATKKKATAKKAASRRNTSPRKKAAATNRKGGGRAKPRQVVIPGSSESAEWLAAAAEVRAAIVPILKRKDALLASDESESTLPLSVAFTLNQIELSDTMAEVLDRHGYTTRGQIENPQALLKRIRLIRPEQIRGAFERAELQVPGDLFADEADRLWSAAKVMWKSEPSSPKLPKRPADRLDGLIALRQWCVLCAAAMTFNTARSLVADLSVITGHARSIADDECSDLEALKLIPTLASAMDVQHDLGMVITSEVMEAASAVYTPASPPPRFGKVPQTGSVLEVVRSYLGSQLRNSVYQGRRTPFDPDVEEAVRKAKTIRPHGYGLFMEDIREVERHRAIKSLGISKPHDAMMVFLRDMKAIDPSVMGYALPFLEMRSVDFDELAVRLGVEAKAAMELCKISHHETDLDPFTLKAALLIPRPGTWYEQAYDYITKTTGHGLMARDLRHGHDKHNLHATKASDGHTNLYKPQDVIVHPKFTQYKRIILEAIEQRFECRPKYIEKYKVLTSKQV